MPPVRVSTILAHVLETGAAVPEGIDQATNLPPCRLRSSRRPGRPRAPPGRHPGHSCGCGVRGTRCWASGSRTTTSLSWPRRSTPPGSSGSSIPSGATVMRPGDAARCSRPAGAGRAARRRCRGDARRSGAGPANATVLADEAVRLVPGRLIADGAGQLRWRATDRKARRPEHRSWTLAGSVIGLITGDDPGAMSIVSAGALRRFVDASR